MSDDPDLADLFAPLGAVEPDAATRSANRAAARAAAQAITRPPWWRRSVEVPLPLVAAAAAVLLVAVGWRTTAPDRVSSPQETPVVAPPPVAPEPSGADRYVETNRYVPGFGVVYRKINYQPQESL